MPTSLPASPWARFICQKLPAIDSLRRYSFKASRADFLAGLSVAAVALPQAMAYGLAAGVPAEYGLYTAIVMTAVGALFASSKQLINGPTNVISGSLTRSAINHQAGARTQWSAVWSAAAVALITLAFASYARFVPRSALAGILMVTAVGMVDWKGLPFHLRATRFDAFIVLTTAIAAVGVSVEFCILIGVRSSTSQPAATRSDCPLRSARRIRA